MHHFDPVSAEIKALFAGMTYAEKLAFLAAAKSLIEGAAPAPSEGGAPDRQD